MKALALTLLAAILWAPLHAEPVAPAPVPTPKIIVEPFPPARFTGLYIEKDEKGRAISIELSGDAVIYKVTVVDKVVETVTAHPTGDDWFQFIQRLNDAKVYTWAPTYEYPGQGASWLIDLTMDDRTFTSRGTNEYPKNGDESQPAADPQAGASIPFLLFWQAVMVLVGKEPPPVKAK